MQMKKDDDNIARSFLHLWGA